MEESQYGFVAIANELLLRFQLPVITDLRECTSNMFVALYEGILGEKHPHIVSVRNKQDEVTNVQVVIDSLAQDVLHADLSHISGQAIVEGDHVTIRYLLEIFTGLLEYIMEQITSGASTDAEDEQSAHDPDILTQGTISTISDILQEELGTRDHSYRTRSRDKANTSQRLKQSDVSLPSTISNVESHYDSVYSGSDSSFERPQHVHAHNTVTITRPQDAGAGEETDKQHNMFGGLTTTVSGPSGRSAWITSNTVGLHSRAAGPSSSAAGPSPGGVGLPSRAVEPPSSVAGPSLSATVSHSRSSWSPSGATVQASWAAGQHSSAALSPTRATNQPSRDVRPTSRNAWSVSKVTRQSSSDAISSSVTTVSPPRSASTPLRATRSPSRTTEQPSRDARSGTAEEDSEGEKIRQRVLENEYIEKCKEMQKIKASVPRNISTDDDSTCNVVSRSTYTERKLRNKGNLQVEEVSSSLTSTSPPSATKHHLPVPTMMREKPKENVFASLGVRPKPMSHPHFRKDNQEERLSNSSKMTSEEDERVRRHVHTHHHFHSSDDGQKFLPERDGNIGNRSSKASHTLTCPPPANDMDEQPMPSRYSHSLQHSDNPRDMDQDDIGSRLRQSLPLPRHTARTKSRPVGYNLRSHRQDEVSAARASKLVPQRRVAFTVKDQDDFHIDEIADEDELMDDLDKEVILQQLRERLINRRSKHRVTRQSSDESDNDSDISQHSDSIIDYDDNPSAKRYRMYSPKRENQTRSSVVKPILKKNHVHFDDALEEEAKGQFGKIRRSIRKEGVSHQRKTKAMREVYANHLEHLETGQKELIDKKKKAAGLLDKKYRQVHQIPKMKRYCAAKKYAAPSVVDLRKRRKVRGQVGKRKRSASSSPTLNRNRRPLVIEDDEMLPTVMSEFPMLHVSPHTAHNMWSKQMRQLEQLTQSGISNTKKTRTQMKMEEAEKRQELLLGIMQKELAYNRRMKDIREKREHEKAMKLKVQEQRQATARARRYYDQFKVRASARMLRRKNREEQIFKKLFEDGLEIQRNRVRELRKYAKEKREEMAVQQQNEIESLENYYSNQFAMLAEAIGQERHDLQVRDSAQAKVMKQMKRELRRKMENEIREFQENLYNDEDREYFRQIEADRMKRELQIAAYKTTL
ncbi:centrosomal protein of 95 kDa-like [Anneissia japonica]|uniref:centrosomal protein of 95 kDa-like n=1 Tax=Anneissia japonica TaxID=1529436 RepID=UPI001425A2FD|nr:centrosomal protein of 95 kDa-like [Anneissia japonica]